MRYILLIILGWTTLLIQIICGNFISVEAAKPNLLVAFVVYLGLFENFVSGFILVFLVSYLFDIFSVGPLGINIISSFFVFAVVKIFSRHLNMENLWLQIFVVLILTFFYTALNTQFLFLLFSKTFITSYTQLFFHALIASILTPLYYMVLKRVVTAFSKIPFPIPKK